MELPSFISQWSLIRRRTQEQASGQAQEPLKAVRVLGARQLDEARRRAQRTLEDARGCGCCASLLAHLFDRLGSTLFLDDDPLELMRAFEDSERDVFSPRVLAACIVLSGRPRVVPVG